MIRRSGAAPEEQAAGPRLRWARGTSFHLFNADAAGDYASELDCRLLFLGGNYGRAIRAYREVVRYMRAVSDPAELADALRSSTVVHDCYDVLHSNGQVSVTLRDAVFCEPGPRQDLTPVLRLKRRRRSWQAPVRWSVLPPWEPCFRWCAAIMMRRRSVPGWTPSCPPPRRHGPSSS